MGSQWGRLGAHKLWPAQGSGHKRTTHSAGQLEVDPRGVPGQQPPHSAHRTQAFFRHWVSSASGRKAPGLGAEIQCGDTEPAPFHLPIQVASPKGAVSPVQLAPSAPAWASWAPRPPAPWFSPALRYLSRRCGREPSPQGPTTMGLRPALGALQEELQHPHLGPDSFPNSPTQPPSLLHCSHHGLNQPEGRTTHQPSKPLSTPATPSLAHRCHFVFNAKGHFCQPRAAWPAPCHRGEYQPARAQTPASHVHQAFTACILAPECPCLLPSWCLGALFFLPNTPLSSLDSDSTECLLHTRLCARTGNTKV